MNITELDPTHEEVLRAFRKREWAIADHQHFGEAGADFNKRSFTLVAHEGQDITGYVTCIVDMGVMYVDSIIVGEAYQKRGIGQALMKAAEDKGRQMGAHKAWLETGAAWDARKLYDLLGYAVVANLAKHYGGADYVIYEKLL